MENLETSHLFKKAFSLQYQRKLRSQRNEGTWINLLSKGSLTGAGPECVGAPDVTACIVSETNREKRSPKTRSRTGDQQIACTLQSVALPTELSSVMFSQGEVPYHDCNFPGNNENRQDLRGRVGETNAQGERLK